MKKILLLIVIALSLTTLTGCFEDIYIEPNEISVVFENPQYRGSSFFIDVYITNGYDTDEFVGYMEFDIYAPNDSVYVAGAGFDIDETVPANSYIMIELEFDSDYVFAYEEDIEAAGYKISEVELYFWIEE